MKPTRLPPLSIQNEAKSDQSKSLTKVLPSPRIAKNENKMETLPLLNTTKPKCKSEEMKAGTSNKDQKHDDNAVPFRSEHNHTKSPSPLNSKNFNGAISPPTPPSFSLQKQKLSSEKSPLNRPQLSNSLSSSTSSKAHTSRLPSSKRRSRASASKSANHIHRKQLSKEPDNPPTTAFFMYSFKQFRNEVDKWKRSKKVNKLQEFYRCAFESFKSINDTFKKSKSHCSSAKSSSISPGIQQKFVGFVFETLLELPKEVQKIVLKGIINCLLSEWKGEKTEADLRAYFILLQNRIFSQVDTYVVYAHLLRQIATLNQSDQTMMTHWLRKLSTPRFRLVIEKLHQFVTLRLFPNQSDELPAMSNCGWWIPSAVKVLSILNDANNLFKPRLVSFREFYNYSLDHIDIMAEFRQWESPASHSGFTFCHFPFILSLVSKLRILKHDQERQMIRSARDDLVASIKRRPTRAPNVNQLFLNITVRRQHLLQDSLEQIFNNRKELKKKLRVEFVGEPGYDMGGLTKEWFLLLLRKVLSPNYNTFVYNSSSRCYWFASNSSENSSDLFLVGVLMGLAVYNCIASDISLPMVCYRKLLSSVPRTPPVLNHPADTLQPTPPAPPTNQSTAAKSQSSNQPSSSSPSSSSQLVGVVPVSLSDLSSLDPDMAHGLQELLDYDGDVEEDFGLTFQTSLDDLGVVKTVPLISGGDKVAVTNSNRAEYVQAVVHHRLNKAVYRQFLAFYHGFYTVCSSNALSFVCPEELELLICGNNCFDLTDLKKFTTYQGYLPNNPTIINFWDVLLSLPRDLQKRFLHFCTGSDRIPVGGMQELNFNIVRTPTTQNMLPMAHTCFNQLLLPPYGSRQQLESKLIIAISNAEGFGLE